ncbi:MAG: hypothetical protein HUJ97_00045 [Bacteroidales bacterium]|nr:hypothetical protein [Bacteroidales bacterium]
MKLVTIIVKDTETGTISKFNTRTKGGRVHTQGAMNGLQVYFRGTDTKTKPVEWDLKSVNDGEYYE